MKKLIVSMLLAFLGLPLTASVKCLDNSKHLTEAVDYKEWHSVACDCPCQTVKNGHCLECGHLQNAETYIVVAPTKVAHHKKSTLLQLPDNPYTVIKKLALQHIQDKQE